MKKRIILLNLLLILLIGPVLAQGKTYYASPTGGGDGLFPSSPFLISDFWNVAKPGDILILLDGIYKGPNSMIDPPDYLSGSEGNPITIKAKNDGMVTIDGEGVRRPVYLYHNDWFVIEGINACNSSKSVVEISRGNHNIIRRVCAWDAADGNTNIFGAHHGEYNLFEDCAGWGIARKIFSSSQHGDHTTFRRCWGRWEHCSEIGPKMVFTVAYNNYYCIIENCIGTWDDDMISVNQPYAIFGYDGFYKSESTYSHSKWLGNIAYRLKTQNTHNPHMFFIRADDFYAENCVAFVEDGAKPAYTFYAFGYNDPEGFKAKNLTSIGGKGTWFYKAHVDNLISINASEYGIHNPELTDYVNVYNNVENFDGDPPAHWFEQDPQLTENGRNILQASLSPVVAGKGKDGEDIGANIWYRYENGVLTDKPLWPWPMNERIRVATCMYDEGLTREECEQRKDLGVNVTKTVFELGGGTMPQFSQQIAALKTASPINIDGELNEIAWSSANYITFSNPSRSDNQVKVLTLWDSDNLYLAYEVTDADLEAIGENLWQDDGAEFYLDTENDKTTSMDDDDYHFIININGKSNELGIITQTKFTPNGYVMEIAIPWALIDVTPEDDKIIGLLLANNDRDNGVISQFDWLNLIETGPYERPDLWGELLLSGEITLNPKPLIPSVIDIKFTEVGRCQEVTSIKKGKWYDLYIYVDDPQGFEDIDFADLWLNSPSYTAGTIENRGGNHYAKSSYIWSYSLSTGDILAKETEGRADWTWITGTLGLYTDDRAGKFEVNSQQGWAKARVKVLSDAELGSWRINGYVVDKEGNKSSLYSKTVTITIGSSNKKEKRSIERKNLHHPLPNNIIIF